jgi:hypothetical protein
MKKRPPKKSARRTKSAVRARPKAAVRGGAGAARTKKKVVAPKGGRSSTSKSPRKLPSKKGVARRKEASPKRASASKAPVKSNPRASARRVRIAPNLGRRPDDADAFLRVGRHDPSSSKDDFAEELAEDFVGAATSGEEQGLETRDSVLDEEAGGPFVTTPAKREFAEGPDASNPEDAEREPFPSAMGQSES